MSGAAQHGAMSWVRLGNGLRAIRRNRGWTQAQTAAKAGVSQSAVSRAERGDAGALAGTTLARIAEALGAQYQPRVLWQGEALDRLLDAAHAGLVNVVVQLLVENGWEVIPEATFSHYGERGSIDVLAWHEAEGALLIVEVKSVVPDIQGLLAGVDRKCRIAPHLATARGWSVRRVSRLIVLPDDRTARRRLESHAATFDVAYPARTVAVRRWLARPHGALSGVLFVPSTRSTTARHRVGGRSGSDGGVPQRSADR
jgi:transcriptional regulator with XRE-family HTH domain